MARLTWPRRPSNIGLIAIKLAYLCFPSFIPPPPPPLPPHHSHTPSHPCFLLHLRLRLHIHCSSVIYLVLLESENEFIGSYRVFLEDEVEEKAVECGGGKTTTTCWRRRDEEDFEDGESEGEEAANADSGGKGAGGGEAVSPHGGLHNAFEVPGRCFASAFQDLQAVKICSTTVRVNHRASVN